jgi:hypothetical protein
MIHPFPPNLTDPSSDNPLRFDDNEYAPEVMAVARPPKIHRSRDASGVARGVAMM